VCTHVLTITTHNWTNKYFTTLCPTAVHIEWISACHISNKKVLCTSVLGGKKNTLLNGYTVI
jgi:hypothetical protein